MRRARRNTPGRGRTRLNRAAIAVPAPLRPRRHIKAGRGDQVCFLWEGNEPKDDAKMTYQQVRGGLGWPVEG
jgi:hypothetical protein